LSPAVLYRHLPGEGLDAFIAEFRRAAARDPFGTALVVPTTRLAREIVGRLGREGAPVVTDTITTLPGLARKVFFDRAATETPISSTESRLIIGQLLAAGDYPLIARAGAVDELATLFEVLITRKIDYPAALGDLAGEKSTEIGRLFAAYIRFLDAHHLIDESTLLPRAAPLLLAGKFRTVYIYGLYEPVPLERDLLLALRKSAEEFHYMLPYKENPAVFADDGLWLHPDTIVWGKSAPAIAGLFSQKAPGRVDNIHLAERRDRLDEVRAIAQEIRDLIAAGVRPGDIAVAFPDLASAVPYIEEVFPDFGLPFTAPGRPLAASPLVRALLSVLAVPAHGYRRGDLIALLKSPYFPFSGGSGIDILSREARITAGAWDERFAALARALEDDPGQGRHRSKIAHIVAAQKEISRLSADLATLEGRKTLSAHVTAYRLLLRQWHAPATPLEDEEARDLRGFTEALAEIESLAHLFCDEDMPLSEFFSLITSHVAGIRAGQQRRRGAVRVIGIREAAHIGIPFLFVADLVEGRMPRLTTRLPFFTDVETRRLQTRSKSDILREERYHFIAALLAARSRIYISYPASDGGRPLVRSVFVDAIQDAFAPRSWGKNDLPDSRLAAARRAGGLLARGEAASPPSLTAAEAIRRINIENYHRKGGYDSPYDGLIENDPALAERFGDDAVFSVKALETYADCPFRFYMEQVANLAPLPPVDPGLAGDERGNLIHRIACRFYADWRRDGNGAITEASYTDALRRILTTGREEADRIHLTSPAWAATREQILGSPAAGPGLLERFLRHETAFADSGLTPQAFEVSFGLPVAAGESEPASVPDAVAIPLDNGTLRLRGRIDRIDTLPDGRFVVTDYKTAHRRPTLADITAGKSLQLPLYISAVEALTGMQGIAGTCYTLRRGEVRNYPVFRDASLKDCFPGSRQGINDIREIVGTTLSNVEDYIAGIRGGRFSPRSDAGLCPTYCGFKTICRFDGLRLLNGEVNAHGAD